MKTLKIEGFTVQTDLDEQAIFQRMCRIDMIDPNSEHALKKIENLLIRIGIIDFIEKVGIDDIPVEKYYYTHSIGYEDRQLEPFNWHKKDNKLTLVYTGAQGGMRWKADIFID